MAKDESDGDERSSGGDADEDAEQDDRGSVDLPFKAYLKLFGTILVSLVLFAALVRGCASCQDKNPLTGEPIQQPPPPGAPAPPPQ